MAENPLSPITIVKTPRPRLPTVKASPVARGDEADMPSQPKPAVAESVAAKPDASASAPVSAPAAKSEVVAPPLSHPFGAQNVAPATIKLKPVLRQATIERTQQIAMPSASSVAYKPAPQLPEVTTKIPDEVANASESIQALKRATQDLKSITAPIPQSAILHKTGIIADKKSEEAGLEVSKATTMRISLSSAIGVAPVKNEAPAKTIRIKRPSDIPGAVAASESPVAEGGNDKPADDAVSANEADATKTIKKSVTMTQRKTLKISRPGATAKPSVKKPSAPEADAANAGVAEEEVAEIPAEDESLPPTAGAPLPLKPNVGAGDEVSHSASVFSLIVQVAACIVVGYLGWLLYQDWLLPMFCGGCAL